jgi:hypothetical protein
MNIGRLAKFGFDVQNGALAQALNKFGQTVIIPQIRETIQKKAYYEGDLWKSVRGVVKPTQDGGLEFVVYFGQTEQDNRYFYWNFIDKGVRGRFGSKIGGNISSSPYSYREKRPPFSVIRDWARGKHGITDVGHVFAIRENIYKYGLKSRPLTEEAFNKANAILSRESELDEAVAEQLEEVLETLIQNGITGANFITLT